MYPLVEVFESLQGEGRNVGRPVVFIRFAGCNLACPWCDTDVRRRFELSLEELVDEVKARRARSVILTGGEPTVQEGMAELVAALKAQGYWIGVETNGTNAAAWLEDIDYVACSPKAEYPEALRLARADEVRIVASSPRVVAFARAVRSRIAARDYYISPCAHGDDIDFATAKDALNALEGFSLSVQLHKILGFR